MATERPAATRPDHPPAPPRRRRPAAEGLLHEAFESRAADLGDAVALRSGAACLTYRELDGRAELLARRLGSLGVGPEVKVGILMGRSPETVVAMLAVLKAGGAYVPLDPAYPRERLAFMLEDSRAALVLSRERWLALVAARPGLRILDLDTCEVDGGRAGPAPPRADPGNLAYMIYTSGSTGRAKGVAIEHRSAVALQHWAGKEFSAGELAGMLASTSICFDLSVFELFVPLAYGGTVILVRDALELPRLPGGRVTLINTVPSAMAELLRLGGVPATVRSVNLAGEALRRDLVERIYRGTGAGRVRNLYGPSEDTTYSTFARIERGVDAPPAVGRPIAGTRAHLLDRRGRAVAGGARGELCLAGAGLARGYFGRPGLSAERFVPDPAAVRPGARLYRTGDLARRLPGGDLDFLGRLDQQVKVRGFRIELGEVETALSRHPAVRENAVLAPETAPGEPSLVAWVSTRTPSPSARELRDFLAASLPAFMLPSLFVRLDELPKTPTGKIDRRALPAPGAARLDLAEAYVAPKNATEELLAGIWSEVLECGRVGVRDHFFALGGHSLLAGRILSRIRDALGVELTLRDLLATPVLADLAELAEAARGAHALTDAPAGVAQRGERPALSFAQQRAWFTSRLDPGAATLNIPLGYALDGDLDRAALAWSFGEVMRRHEALRTRFPEEAGEPYQAIAPAAPFTLPLVDLGGLAGEDRRRALAGLDRREAGRPFDLARGPVLRATLVASGGGHVLLLTVHHIVFDDWSQGLLHEELSALYTARRRGLGPEVLPAPAVQYADFAAWQRRWMPAVLEGQLAYWRRRLAEVTALELAADRPRPRSGSLLGATEPFVLPAALAETLEELGRRRGATLFMTALAGFQALLHRYTGQDGFAVAVPVANRNRSEIEGMVGFFVNLIALTADHSGEPSFRELLSRVRRAALDGYVHQDLPFEALVAELAPERRGGRNPLCQVVLQLRDQPLPALELRGLTVTARARTTGAAQFELNLAMTRGEAGLCGTLEYASTLFDVTTIRRFLGHFSALLASAAAEPGRGLSELPLIGAAERHQLLGEWNGARTGRGPERPVHELFEARAARAPDAVALSFLQRRWSYRELDRRANRLANFLRALGVGPETPVCLCVERSPDLVWAILGILKAGGAYVPLDPSHPPERLAFILADTLAAASRTGRGRPALVTWERFAGLFPAAASGDCQRLSLDAENTGLASASPDRPAVDIDGGHLAYVIYTSGSTGRPKGVEVTHANVARLLAATEGGFGFGEGDVWTLFHSQAFDFSVWEIWGALAYGGRLVVVPRATTRSPGRFRELLADEGVTVLNQTPSAFRQLVDAEEHYGSRLTALKRVIFGGEALELASLAPWIARYGDRVPELTNMYGITETTVHVTWRRVEAADLRRAGASPVGVPIPDLRVHVTGPDLGLLPIGAAGEMAVGGPGLARGYLGRPALTARFFVPDPSAVHPSTADLLTGHPSAGRPFTARPGARLYRSGDVARRRATGELEYLRRLDNQVKIRGYRIELGEIESALGAHPAVKASAVVAVDGRLVAWVVPAGEAPAPAGLRSHLERELPGFMVPSFFAVIDRLPLTANGKVDRRSLARRPTPAPEQVDSEAPRSAAEELVAGIWSRVLDEPSIGVRESFFALGGHSLLATRVLSRIRDACGVDVPVEVFFQTPTVRALAAAVENERRGASGAAAATLTPVGRGALLPLSFGQQRLWFLARLVPDDPTYNIPAAFRLSGDLDRAALAWGLAEVTRRHEVLRTRFVEVEGEPFQEIGEPRTAVLTVVDLGGLAVAARGRELPRLGRAEARRPFDLVRGPVLRAVLVDLGAAPPGLPPEHVLLLTVHHVAFDGWSEGILYRELAALYAARKASLPSPLDALPVQYADYAVWQRRWLREDLLAGELAYWKRELAGAPAVLELPADRPRPPIQTFHGASEPVQLEDAVAEDLERLARSRDVTVFMTLLAALAALLARVTGQRDVVTGTVVANRNRSEVEELIGFFVNTLVLRTDVTDDPSFAGLLARVRRKALDAYCHQDLPFERLVDELSPERNLSHQPLVQVMFGFQSAPPPALELGGLRTAPLAFAASVARFDLTLALFGGGGLGGFVEFNTDLFDRTTVQRFSRHFASLLGRATAEPRRRVSELAPLSAAERQQLVREWNDTAGAFPEETLAHQFFEARADGSPQAIAAVCGSSALTYGALETRANKLAHFLRSLSTEPGEPVALWMERGLDMIAGVLAILKAGAYYLPLDASWPADRVAAILAEAGARRLLTRRPLLPAVLELQWRLPALRDVVCLDVATPKPPPESLDPESVRALFDYVAERALDRASAGGFVSSFTGEPFSEAEVDEYRDRVVGLAAAFLGPGKRVLEIGCGSGLILWEIAPRVERCVGLDPSPLTQERNRTYAEQHGHANVELLTGFADDVAALPAASFDLVVLASTAQFFPGPLYLERILELALGRLAPGGALVVADVLDARRRDELCRSLEDVAARRAPERAATGPDNLLRLDEDYFRDLVSSRPEVARLEVRHRRRGFDNELRFRYDVVLTKARADGAGSAPRGERRKRLWTGWHAGRSPAGRPRQVLRDALAYVVHTSGSTGRPKGIAVRHRAAVNLISWVNGTFGVSPADRLLFVTSLAFDLSVYDILGTLAAGGAIEVAPRPSLRDPERLAAMLRRRRITIWDSAPAALQQIAPFLGASPRREPGLGLVLLSGDWIPVSLPGAVRAAFPGARVVSLGGATEATVWSNWYPVGAVAPGWVSIPYGRPILNARYRVLDGGGRPCPIGVAGDLMIGGDCLSVGYSPQPGKTADSFVPDPFDPVPGARLYRTGDRARHFADGNLEFLGRLDQQVKVRGFRIELGEIEVALARHPGIRQAVVLARREEPGGERLTAYLVPARERVPALGELRDFLRRSLPEYMLPAGAVPLSAVPLTANGKVDRRALAELRVPELDRAPSGGLVAPRTPTEEVLAGIWRDLLGVAPGVHDDFFELGGHSLLASQAISRLRDRLGVAVPLQSIFQGPTIAELAEAVRAERPGRRPAPPPLRPEPREGPAPLSFSQLRQWFLMQLEPDTPDYNLPLSLRLAGAADPAVLRRAVAEIVRRHEVLRTTFAAAGDHPAAVAAPGPAPALPVADLTALPAAARRAETRRRVNAEAVRPFDLSRGPLLRTVLLDLGAGGEAGGEPADERLLLATVHHIVFDGWSLGVFMRELATLYEAFSAGRPSPLPELEVQYADYACWQRRWLDGEVLAELSEFWRSQLAGASEVLALPTDRPRSAVRGVRGGSEFLTLPAGLGRELESLCSREKATLFMTLLAALDTLLYRYTGQDDFNVGTYVANRTGDEAIEHLIGLFVNTLVLRADLSGAPTFRELLARVWKTTIAAFDHQELPFERLLDELEVERDLSRTPLFQVMFGLQNYAAPSVERSGLTIRSVELDDVTRTQTDLALWIWEEGGELSCWMQFSTELFERTTARRILRHFAGLLAAAAADPGRRLGEIGFLSAAESHQVAAEWSSAAEVPVPCRRIHELFEARAALTPDARAVVFASRTLSFRELNRRANRLAHHLRRLGVARDEVVGLCLERGPDMLSAVFAVLKAGGAYLPLAPDLPGERLAWMLADTRARVLLTQERLASKVRSFPGIALRLDSQRARFAAEPEHDPARLGTAEDLAYVLFTSGSTGTPKGVMVPHRALASYVEAAVSLYGVGPGDRILQFASLSFDNSAEEIYPCLTRGAAVFLRAESTIDTPSVFLETCAAWELSILSLPTAYWHELADHAARHRPDVARALRLVIFGGERVLPERVRSWQESMGRTLRLMNTYGPSETTVMATGFDVGAPEAADVPIGRPMPNVRTWVTDRRLRLAGAGLPGELVIGGASLARGYFGRPGLTAERFAPPPLGTRPGERVYKSGDSVRYLGDGNIEFLGRVDDQIKIRGFRIEPGEVAAALCRHPAVEDAVVVPRQVRTGGTALVAYVVTRAGNGSEAAPSEAPRGRSGAERGEPFPSGLAEELLAEVLGRLPAADNGGGELTDLDGPTLLELVTGVEDAVGVRLAARDLLQCRTLAELAVTLEEKLLDEIEEMSEEEAERLVA